MFCSCKLDNNTKIDDNDASVGDRVDDVGADTQILEDVNDDHNIDWEYDDDDAANDDDDDDAANDDDDDVGVAADNEYDDGGDDDDDIKYDGDDGIVN